jgi:5-methylcytosine-specific restriction endonuclease McrA
VIRLVKYVEIPRRLRKHVTNAILFARDNYRCQYCSKHRNDLGRRDRLTRDHVKPISKGGLNTWDNVVTACTKCNARKGNRLPMECGMYPKTTPKSRATSSWSGTPATSTRSSAATWTSSTEPGG